MTPPRSTFRERLLDGSPTVGTFLNLGSPITAEICAMAGFDWVLVDLEHGAGTGADLIGQLQAVSHTGAAPLVRVELAARWNAARALDAGACGVMFPRVNSVEEARQAVSYLRFPPRGLRGVAVQNRAARFGGIGVRDLPAVDDTIVGIIQIETAGAVGDVGDIAAIDGVDVLFVGPGDLSYALGVPGQYDHARYLEALHAVVEAGRRHGALAGVLVTTVEEADKHATLGFRFIGVGSDSAMVMRSALAIVQEFRK